MTKLVFMGTPAFSATVLEGLLTDEHYDMVLMGLLLRLMDNFCQASYLIAWILQ